MVYQRCVKMVCICSCMVTEKGSPGGLLSPNLYMDVPAGPQKLAWLSLKQFFAQLSPISIPFSIENYPILPKLGAFYHQLLKIHPIYVNWVPSSVMKTRWFLYQNPPKSTPKGRHIYVYHVNVSTPPSMVIEDSSRIGCVSVKRDHICDMIKGNESHVGMFNFDFSM